MPAAGWNGKLQVVGNGGFAGTISYEAMATAAAAGYASASTDTGHTGPAANTFVNDDVRWTLLIAPSTKPPWRPSGSWTRSTVRRRSLPTSMAAQPAAARR